MGSTCISSILERLSIRVPHHIVKSEHSINRTQLTIDELFKNPTETIKPSTTAQDPIVVSEGLCHSPPPPPQKSATFIVAFVF